MSLKAIAFVAESSDLIVSPLLMDCMRGLVVEWCGCINQIKCAPVCNLHAGRPILRGDIKLFVMSAVETFLARTNAGPRGFVYA